MVAILSDHEIRCICTFEMVMFWLHMFRHIVAVLCVREIGKTKNNTGKLFETLMRMMQGCGMTAL